MFWDRLGGADMAASRDVCDFRGSQTSQSAQSLYCNTVKSCFFDKILRRATAHPPAGRSRFVAEAMERKRPSVGAGPARAGWRKRRSRAALSLGRGQGTYNFG